MKLIHLSALLFTLIPFAATIHPLDTDYDLSPELTTTWISEHDLTAERARLTTHQELTRRKGPGGGGKGGGGGGGSSGSGGRGGSTIGGRPASSYSFSSYSNLGGRTRDGSGTPPVYNGRYSGGALVPYTAGRVSPTRNVSPYLLGGAAFGFFPGIWLYSVWSYPYYGYGYHWIENGRNRTANVTCLCQEYGVCGCDPVTNGQNGSDTVARQLTNGVGSGAPVNSSQVQTIDYPNGTTISYINGTLDNGTTTTGGTDPSDVDEVSAATRLMKVYGPWLTTATVISMLVHVI